MPFLPTMSVYLLSNYHPFKLHTPGINLVLDYGDNFKLFSVVHYEQLRKLQSVRNTWYSMEFLKKLTIWKLKIPSESSTMKPANIARTSSVPSTLILKWISNILPPISVLLNSKAKFLKVWSLRHLNLIHGGFLLKTWIPISYPKLTHALLGRNRKVFF